MDQESFHYSTSLNQGFVGWNWEQQAFSQFQIECNIEGISSDKIEGGKKNI